VISPYHTTARVDQRRDDMYGAAEAARSRRLARQARARSGSELRERAFGEPVALRDGSSVLVRAVEAADAPLLLDGFSRLSERSRFLRFLTGKRELRASEVRFLTEVDHYDHEAIGALDPREGRGVGVARYVRSTGDPLEAELAVTVVDAWQGRGVGTLLLSRLTARARQCGLFAFTALVSADNVPMIRMLRKSGGVDLVHAEVDTLEYEISLASFERSLAACV
jgi:GNAT superfamily N-acetyltransferase